MQICLSWGRFVCLLFSSGKQKTNISFISSICVTDPGDPGLFNPLIRVCAHVWCALWNTRLE